MGNPNYVERFEPSDVLTAEGVISAALAAYYETAKFHRAPAGDDGDNWSCAEDFAQHLAASIASRIVTQVTQRTGVPFGFNVGEFNVPQESHCHG